jgi:FkbM family methyltransferase
MIGPPRRNVVTFVVDGVKFDLDMTAYPLNAQRHHRKLAESGHLYEPVMTRCLARLMSHVEAPQFLDIGGYAGYYTCYAATLLGDRGTVASIESNPSYCEGIRQSVELNGLRNVQLYEAALSDAAETVGIHDREVLFGNHATARLTTSIKLDEMVRRGSMPIPNVLKMDIHGGEGKAVRGMVSVLETMDYFLMELHGHHRLQQYSPGVSRSAILKFLWDLELSVYFIAGHRAEGELEDYDCIRSGRFAYRRVTPESVDCLFFDRLGETLLLVTRRDDVSDVLGDSLDDPLLSY